MVGRASPAGAAPPGIEIRRSPGDDAEPLTTLYRSAFPDEDLLPLLHALAAMPAQTLSLIACATENPSAHGEGGGDEPGAGGAAGDDEAAPVRANGVEVLGHVLFTWGDAGDERLPAVLLAPLAVRPLRQRCGIGSALVREGLRRLFGDGVQQVFVLGDPAYYGRFGFARESRVPPPYPLPDQWHDAWQSLVSPGASQPADRGPLRLPAPWMDRALWSP